MCVYCEMPDETTGWVFGEYEDTYRRVDGECRFAEMVNHVFADTGEGSPHMQ